MAPLRTAARGDGAGEFATPDRSLPRNDSRARLIPELRSRNISSFRAGRVERAGKSLGKPIILEPAPHTLLASATTRLLYSPHLIQPRGRWL